MKGIVWSRRRRRRKGRGNGDDGGRRKNKYQLEKVDEEGATD